MTQKQLVHNVMDALQLPEDRYILSGSAVLYLHGVPREKPMGDIDIFVPTRTWFELLNTPRVDLPAPHNRWQVWTTDPDDTMRRQDPPYLYRTVCGIEVNVFHSWRKRGVGDIDVAFWMCNPEMVEGIRCIPLQFLLDWKEQVGRDKDQQDIKLLREYLYPIRTEDVQVDVYTAGINNTHVRVTHKPTGLVAECGEFASQLANREYALERLREMLIEEQRKG